MHVNRKLQPADQGKIMNSLSRSFLRGRSASRAHLDSKIRCSINVHAKIALLGLLNLCKNSLIYGILWDGIQSSFPCLKWDKAFHLIDHRRDLRVRNWINLWTGSSGWLTIWDHRCRLRIPGSVSVISETPIYFTDGFFSNLLSLVDSEEEDATALAASAWPLSISFDLLRNGHNENYYEDDNRHYNNRHNGSSPDSHY
jgi:hypothetical protein